MKKTALTLLIAAFAWSSAFADVPAAPNVTTVTYINGRMCIAVWYLDRAYIDT